MLEHLRKALMMGAGLNLMHGMGIVRQDDDLSVIELDESLADAEKPEELPPGVYIGEIQDVQVQTSSGKGNQYYAVKFVVPEDEIPANVREGFPDGATLFWNRQLVPKKGDRRSLWNMRRFYESLGLELTNVIDPNEWMGCRARLRVRMGKWEGQDRAEIQSIEAAEAEARPSASRTRTAAVAEEANSGRTARGGRNRRGARA